MTSKCIKDLYIMMLSAVSVSVLTYGNYIYRSTLNIDGEFADNFYQTVSLGRWFHAFLRYYILPEPFMPIFTPLLSVSLLCVSSILFCRMFKLNLIPSVITIIIFISSPQLSYQLEFLNQSDTFAIGLLLCTVASHILVSRNGYVSFIVSVLLTTMALGIYQTLISYFVAVIVSYYTVMIYRRDVDKRDLAKIVVKCSLSALIAVVLYIIVTSQTKSHFNVNASSYLSSYFSLSDGLFHHFIFAIYGFVKASLGLLFYGGLTIAIAFITPIYFYSLYLRKKNKHGLLLTVMTALVPIITFSFIAISGPSSPPRLFVACGVALCLPYILFSLHVKRAKLLNYIACFMVLVNILYVNTLFNSDYNVRQKDVAMAKEIIESTKGFLGKCDGMSVYIHGSFDKNNTMGSSSDTFGKSFFWWDGGNYLRIVAFMNYYGICDNIHPATENDVKKVLDNINNKPEWPNSGSVYLDNNVLVIKLSNKIGWLPFQP